MSGGGDRSDAQGNGVTIMKEKFPNLAEPILQSFLSRFNNNAKDAISAILRVMSQGPSPPTTAEWPSSVGRIHGENSSECGYCHKSSDGRVSFGVTIYRLTVAHYQELANRNWRRSGTYLYKPVNEKACCGHYTIRLDVTQFNRNAKQRQVHRRITNFLAHDTLSPARPNPYQLQPSILSPPTSSSTSTASAAIPPTPPKKPNKGSNNRSTVPPEISAAVTSALQSVVSRNMPLPHQEHINSMMQQKIKPKVWQNPPKMQRTRGIYSCNVAMIVSAEFRKMFPAAVSTPLPTEPTCTPVLPEAPGHKPLTEKHGLGICVPLCVDSCKSVITPLIEKQSLGELICAVLAGILTKWSVKYDSGYVNFFDATSQAKHESPLGLSFPQTEQEEEQTVRKRRHEEMIEAEVDIAALKRASSPPVRMRGVGKRVVPRRVAFAAPDQETELTRNSLEQLQLSPTTPLQTPPPQQAPPPMHVLQFSMHPSEFIAEEYELYKKYQMSIHHDSEDDISEKSYTHFLVETPLLPYPIPGEVRYGVKEYGSYHMQYRLDGKLIAVGVIDILPECLSSVYFFYDPQYKKLSLGVYSALMEIDWLLDTCKTIPGLKYYYMGYYIHTCPKMKYKGQFVPSELWSEHTGRWVPLSSCEPLLNAARESHQPFINIDQSIPTTTTTTSSASAATQTPTSVSAAAGPAAPRLPVQAQVTQLKVWADGRIVSYKDIIPKYQPLLQQWAKFAGPTLTSQILCML